MTPRTSIESATGKSTFATVTDVKDDTALSCVAVPMKSALDLSGFSWESILHIPLLDVGGTSGENGQAGS